MQIYLDCDGVLADFDQGFVNRFGDPPRAYEDKHGEAAFWLAIQNGTEEFFRNLSPMPDAFELYEGVAHLEPIILTGCPRGGWAEPQKLAWAEEHFPGVPMITCASRNKRDHCQPGDVLIDDLLKYRHLWIGAGGHFIHHTSAATSLGALKAL